MKVTVGLPIYTEPLPYVESAIRSIFAQTWTDWSLLILTDDAPAETVEYLRAVSDSRVHLIISDERQGLSKRLNQITALAEDDIVFRMDADDVMLPTRLAAQIAALEGDPTLDVVGSRAYLIDEESYIHGLRREPSLPTSAVGYLDNTVFTHPSIAASRTWFQQYPYREELARGQDKGLWLDSHATSSFLKLAEPLILYRFARNLTLDKNRLSNRFDRQLIAEYGPSLLGKWNTRRRLAMSLGKQAVYTIGVTVGQSNAIYRTKFEPILADQRTALDSTLRMISTVNVPGWERPLSARP